MSILFNLTIKKKNFKNKLETYMFKIKTKLNKLKKDIQLKLITSIQKNYSRMMIKTTRKMMAFKIRANKSKVKNKLKTLYKN